MNGEMPIIVEGRHDVRVLRSLGIRGEVLVLNVGMSLVDFAYTIASKYHDVILLLDWDPEGEALCRRLTELLESLGVDTHPEVRNAILELLPHVSTVEELIL